MVDDACYNYSARQMNCTKLWRVRIGCSEDLEKFQIYQSYSKFCQLFTDLGYFYVQPILNVREAQTSGKVDFRKSHFNIPTKFKAI